MRPPALMIAGGSLALAALAGCSSEKASEDTQSTVSIMPTTSIAATTSTVAPTSIAPETTSAPTTAATTPPTTTGPTYALYEPVRSPQLPAGHTDAVAGPTGLADGTYWTVYLGGDAAAPVFEVYQAFLGEECITEADARGEECLNDIYVPSDEYRTIDDVPFATDVFLTVSDVNSQQSYWITPTELVQIRGSSPSAAAPAGYEFIPFAFLMTVEDGAIVAFEQIWTP